MDTPKHSVGNLLGMPSGLSPRPTFRACRGGPRPRSTDLGNRGSEVPVFAMAVRRFSITFQDTDDFSHGDPLRLSSKQIAALRSTDTQHEPLFLETMKQLLEIRDRQILLFRNEGDGHRSSPRGKTQLH